MLDSVTINQLRVFTAVADEGSFSGAARRLRRAQSAISHAITALESALQVELFARDTRKAELSAAGRSLLPDARAVLARTQEMKNRASSIAKTGAPQLSIAVDVYFPRAHLIDCLRTLQMGVPTAVINLRMTSMQAGEELLLEGTCSLAVTIAEVPEVSPSAIERQWLAETQMLTVCAPEHPLASSSEAIPVEELARHIQLVVIGNQPGAETTLKGVAGERQWLLNDLSAKHDLLRAGLGWGHMPAHLVADDLANGTLIELERRAWDIGPLTFMVSRRRGHQASACETQLLDLMGRLDRDCLPAAQTRAAARRVRSRGSQSGRGRRKDR